MIVTTSLFCFGITKTLLNAILKPLPVIELVIKSHIVKVIKQGRVVIETFNLQDFSISQNHISFTSKDKVFELNLLDLSNQEVEQLSADLNAASQAMKIDSLIRQKLRRRTKERFILFLKYGRRSKNLNSLQNKNPT